MIVLYVELKMVFFVLYTEQRINYYIIPTTR